MNYFERNGEHCHVFFLADSRYMPRYPHHLSKIQRPMTPEPDDEILTQQVDSIVSQDNEECAHHVQESDEDLENLWSLTWNLNMMKVMIQR